MHIVPITPEHREEPWSWVCTEGESDGRGCCGAPATFEDTDNFGFAYCNKHVPAGTCTEGRKNDAGKLRFDLIPPHALEALAYVYTIGAAKYGDNNWLKGMERKRILAAMFRHINHWQKGVTVDPDDQQHPLASVAWCAFALMEYERLGLGIAKDGMGQDATKE